MTEEYCRDCRTVMKEVRKDHFECPECGHSTWVIRATPTELKRLGRVAYIDGRHWNHGGGLNK